MNKAKEGQNNGTEFYNILPNRGSKKDNCTQLHQILVGYG